MALTLQQVRTLPAFSDMSDSDIISHAKSNGFDTSAMQAEDSSEEDGNAVRGFKNAFRQLPQLGRGLEAAAGATGEALFGEGGLSTGIKKNGLAGLAVANQNMEEHAKPTDSLTYSYDKAKEGDIQALGDWVAHGVGYAGGQAIQMMATAGAGNVVAKAVLPSVLKATTERMVANEAAKLTTAQAAKVAEASAAGSATEILAPEAINKLAVATVTDKLGQIGTNAALAGSAFGMEGGEIGGDLAQQSADRGTPLTGGEIAKGLGATALAGGLEFAGDKLGLDLLTGKSSIYKALETTTGTAGRVGRGAVGAVGGSLGEGATEYGQTYLEQVGEGKDTGTEASKVDRFDSAGQGALGGHVMGGVGGFLTAARAKTPEEIAAAELKRQQDLSATASTGPLGNALATGGIASTPEQLALPELIFTADGRSFSKKELIDGFKNNGADDQQALNYLSAITAIPVEHRTPENLLSTYAALQEKTKQDQATAQEIAAHNQYMSNRANELASQPALSNIVNDSAELDANAQPDQALAFHEKEQADLAQKDAELKAMALRTENTPEQTREYRKKRLELRAQSDQLNQDLAEALRTSSGEEAKNTQLSDQLHSVLNVKPRSTITSNLPTTDHRSDAERAGTPTGASDSATTEGFNHDQSTSTQPIPEQSQQASGPSDKSLDSQVSNEVAEIAPEESPFVKVTDNKGKAFHVLKSDFDSDKEALPKHSIITGKRLPTPLLRQDIASEETTGQVEVPKSGDVVNPSSNPAVDESNDQASLSVSQPLQVEDSTLHEIAATQLRAIAKPTEASGDVQMADSGLFVPFDHTVRLAKEAIESGNVRPTPFQVSEHLNIGMRDVDRVLSAAIVKQPSSTQATETVDKLPETGALATNDQAINKQPIKSTIDDLVTDFYVKAAWMDRKDKEDEWANKFADKLAEHDGDNSTKEKYLNLANELIKTRNKDNSYRWLNSPHIMGRIELSGIIEKEKALTQQSPEATQTTADVQSSGEKVDTYHPAIHSLAADLTVGGGVSYTTDEHGKINGRTASTNPEWFKDKSFVIFKPDGQQYASTPSVKEVQQAVDDHKKGKPLKPKQTSILKALHDIAQDQEDYANQSHHDGDFFMSDIGYINEDTQEAADYFYNNLSDEEFDRTLESYDDEVPFDVQGSNMSIKQLEDWLGITDEQNKDDKEIGLKKSDTLSSEDALGSYTAAELATREREQAQRYKQAAADELKAKQKEAADKSIDSFADEMLGNTGNTDLFGGNPLADLGRADTIKGASPEMKAAQAKAEQALSDLGAIFLDANLFANKAVPVKLDGSKLLPVLSKLMSAYIEMGYINFKENAAAVLAVIREKFGDAAADSLSMANFRAAYNNTEQGNTPEEDVIKFKTFEQLHQAEKEHAPSTNADLESDSKNTGTKDLDVSGTVQPGRKSSDKSTGQTSNKAESTRNDSGLDSSDPINPTALDREPSDQQIHTTEQPALSSELPAGVTDSDRSGNTGNAGIQADNKPINKIKELAKQRVTTPATTGKVILADATSIADTLPILNKGQQADVLFAEKRLEEHKGVLFTNGTGTGKTFTALGIIKRFALQGKKSAIIVVPSVNIAQQWIDAATKFFDLTISPLENTRDNGKGIVISTYANFGMNESLPLREWDLVVADESHKLLQNEAGVKTDALDTLRGITYHRNGFYPWFNATYSKVVGDLHAAKIDYEATRANDVRDDVKRLADKNYETKQATYNKTIEKAKLDYEVLRKEKDPKVVLLSATPFAYAKTVDYAEGLLFHYGTGRDGGGYNSGNDQDHFFMNHFGYRMRYNKLTKPDAKVDTGLMERQFNSTLRKTGALSFRALDVDFDYDRKFILIDSVMGRRIDEALDWIREQKYDLLSDLLKDKFDYLQRRYMLEALKAREAVKIVAEHLAIGRKVLVFHDYKKGGVRNPFIFSMTIDKELNDQISDFNTKFSDIINEFDSLPSPIDLFRHAFRDDVMIYNGSIPSKERIKLVQSFNDDNSGKNLILVQSASAKEGVSFHDTTGKHPRVLFNLGLPTQPTTAIQQEGRIYRVGQESDAMFRYLNTGTSWERWAFATTIAQRASTAENLAAGEGARALKQSFIDGFQDSDTYPAGFEGEGKGGKEIDKAAASAITEFDRAKTYYFGQGKKTSRNKSAEGKDYFATPEPVGWFMTQLADARTGDSMLEPSAGHGAIARFFRDDAKTTAIEPSGELSSRLAMVFDGDVKRMDFEDLDIHNKYHTIVMNPPFGVGGKVAIEHLDKATKHLPMNGRVVALIPEGGTADKRFDKWLYGDDKGAKGLEGLYLAANISLPTCTFERAGTQVKTRIVVIDRVSNDDAKNIHARNIDLSSIEDINKLFDRIEDLTVQPRNVTEQKEEAPKPTANASANTAGDKYITSEPETTYTTKKGKVLHGVIAKDIDLAEAQKFDKYAWKRDGGIFIRMDNVARPDSGTALFSKAQSEVSNPHTKSSLHAAISKALDKVFGQGWVQRLEATGKFKFISRDEAIQIAGNQASDAKGFYDANTDTTYFVYDNISKDASNKALLKLVLHEVGVHALQMGKTNEAFQALLKRFEAMKKTNPKVQAAFDSVPSDTKAEDKLEEALAYFIEHYADSTIAQRIIEAFRQLVRAIGNNIKGMDKLKFMQWANKLTETELQNMAVSALRNAPSDLQFDNVGREADGVKLSGDNKEAPLVKLTGDEITGETPKITRNVANDFVGMLIELLNEKEIYSLKNKATGFDVVITTKGVKHGYQHHGSEQVKAVAAIKQLIENALPVTNNPHDPVSPEAHTVHTFVAPLQIGNKYFAVKLTIKEGSNGFKLYDHNALEMAKPDSIDAGLSSATPLKNAEKLDYRSISGLPVSLEQMLEAFKGKYDKYLQNKDGIKFSRSTPTNTPAPKSMAGLADQARQFIANHTDSAKTFNWWHNTIGTQAHKATVDGHFKKVFEASMAMEESTAKFANAAADRSPSLLPKLEGLKSISDEILKAQGWKRNKDAKAIGQAIFQTTLDDKPLTEAELVAQGYTAKQRTMYHEFFAAINQSMDDLAKSEMLREAKALSLVPANESLSLKDTASFYADQVDDANIIKSFFNKAEQIKKLQDQGYAPLMRFGQYTLDVNETLADGTEKRVFFGLFESQAEANEMAAAMQSEYPEATIAKGIMSQQDWQLFKGITPETMEVFAKLMNVDKDAAFQEYLKSAVNNRSALKRLIHRKKMPGFAADPQRVLASFITSNAKASAKNIHLGDMVKAITDIPKAKGDVLDEAVNLYNYVQNPSEKGAAIRGLLFTWYLGGSVASAMVNLTQTLTTTTPYLHQFGETQQVARIMAKAMKLAALKSGAIGGDLGKALKLAGEEGVTEPQELHMLYGESMRTGIIQSQLLRPLTKAWGSLFSLAESYNRRVAFIAAYTLAKETNKPDAFAFAAKAVNDTQFIYNKSARPNWSRSTVGSMVFTFKTFSINYLEFLKQLPPKERLIALGILIVLSGLSGLPGDDDADDIIDSIGQGLGYNTNTKSWKQSALSDMVGKTAANYMLHGISAGLPVDLSQRLGAGNLIPGSALFKRSETNKTRDIAEFVGPVGGLFTKGMDAFDAAQTRQGLGNKLSAVGKAIVPKAISDAWQGLDMLQSGQYKDVRGKKVVNTDATDALFKAIGLQPSSVAEQRRAERYLAQDVQLTKSVESDIAGLWAQGLNEKDQDKVKEAQSLLKDWNDKNHDTPIRISHSQIVRRVKQMRLSSRDRLLKTAPKELRRYANQSLANEE